MDPLELDAIRQGHDAANKERPRDPRSTTQIERDIRWLARQTVREVHERPWLYGPPAERRQALMTARRYHSQSIAREYQK